MANFIGLSQAGAPVMTRGSSRSPARDTARGPAASSRRRKRAANSKTGRVLLRHAARTPSQIARSCRTLFCHSRAYAHHLPLPRFLASISRQEVDPAIRPGLARQARSAVPVRAEDVSLRLFAHDPSLRHAFSFQIPLWLENPTRLTANASRVRIASHDATTDTTPVKPACPSGSSRDAATRRRVRAASSLLPLLSDRRSAPANPSRPSV
jgi:hypothetical protein